MNLTSTARPTVTTPNGRIAEHLEMPAKVQRTTIQRWAYSPDDTVQFLFTEEESGYGTRVQVWLADGTYLGELDGSIEAPQTFTAGKVYSTGSLKPRMRYAVTDSIDMMRPSYERYTERVDGRPNAMRALLRSYEQRAR